MSDNPEIPAVAYLSLTLSLTDTVQVTLGRHQGSEDLWTSAMEGPISWENTHAGRLLCSLPKFRIYNILCTRL